MPWIWTGLVGIAAAVVVFGVVGGQTLIESGSTGDRIGSVFVIVLIVLYSGLGSLIAARQPGNRIAWLFFLIGLGILGSITLDLLTRVPQATETFWTYLPFALQDPFVQSVVFYPLFLIPFVFPTGRFLTRRWSWAGWLGAVTIPILILLIVLSADVERAYDAAFAATNPIGVLPGDMLSAVNEFWGYAVAVLGLGGPVALTVRFRRSSQLVRAQIKWLLFAALFFLPSLALLGVVPEDWIGALLGLPLTLILIAVTIAITRYRLYDIDVVISRTVVLAVLAGFITITYSLVVVGVGQLIGGDSGGLGLPIAATAIVAVAFEPIRLRAQRWANRLVYGTRATPYQVLADVTARLAVAEEGEGILDRMATLLRDGTGADRATVWIGPDGSMSAAASVPNEVESGWQPSLESDEAFPVSHDDELVGALEVVKPRGSVLSSAERSLVSDIAGSVGAVLGYQRLNDSLQERAKELEESRARLMGVQDQERRRLERDLHEGAEQFIVALKVKVGVASQMAGKHEAPDLAKLLEGLTDEAQAALDDVQSLAKGIYPPILESDGLGPAVSALASSTPVEVSVRRDGLGRYPAEVEAAAYFDVSEAVTNAVKHAKPPIRIELSEHDGFLTFSVLDSGPGFDVDQDNPGSGLVNMADRLDAVGGALVVRSSSGEPTEVSGRIPLG